MKFAFVAAVGGIGLEDVAVAGFQFAIDRTFLYSTGADVVGKYTHQECVGWFEVAEEVDKFVEVFTQESVSLPFTHLIAAIVFLSGQFSVTISEVGPMLPGIMQGLMVLDRKSVV